MTAPSGVGPIKQALVKAMRDHAALKAAVSNEFHESFAPRDIGYPFVLYILAYAPIRYDWTGAIIKAGFDVHIISDSQVEAHNLDQLLSEALHDKVLDLSGSSPAQTTLLCRRVANLSSVDLDDVGTKVYGVGGTFELWTDQHTA
jgi:hypothetical protein